MSHQTRIFDLINQFNKEYGLPNHDFAASPYVEFALGEEMSITLSYDDASDQLIAFSEVEQLNDHPSPNVLKKLLCANWFWQETAGATLSLEGASNQLFLSQKFHAAALNRTEELVQRFETLVDQVRHWRESLQEEQGGAAPETPHTAGLHQITAVENPSIPPMPWNFA
ncbi:type III secretion system chaperone [Acanthopleuribacter pedis]|uniref:Type III secretion system chaperone n=1 Tax=Acanthopleuribacter pedis TaxID=442870 RepID=A0A8J7U1P6_9BACT|nr:type III secretion system chaperone [Acanthopleuribacter pedis]MBO1317747.1 type III secretion system chaperone [Acanthopleuribacter pedis]